jgi:hypothetical protein
MRQANKHVLLKSSYDTRKFGISITFLLFMLTAIFGYWAFLTYTPFKILISELEGISFSIRPDLMQSYYGISITYPGIWRLIIARYADFGFALVVGGISLYQIFSHQRRTIDLTFLMWGVLLGLFAINKSIFIRSLPGWAGTSWGERLIVFGYLTLLPLSVSIFKPYRMKGVYLLRAILFSAIIIYAFIGTFHIPPSLYTISEDPYEVDGRRYYFLPSEERAVFWFSGRGNIAVDPQLPISLLGSVKPELRFDFGSIDLQSIEEIKNYDYAFLCEKSSTRLEVLNYLNKIYTNRVVEIYAGQKSP